LVIFLSGCYSNVKPEISIRDINDLIQDSNLSFIEIYGKIKVEIASER